MIEKLKYRMYGLVPYNISPIQQGIQFGHGVVEYMMNNFKTQVEEYNKQGGFGRMVYPFILKKL